MAGLEVRRLIVKGDSQLVVNQVNKDYQCSDPIVGVCYRQYYLYGGSSGCKSDGSTRRSKQDAEF